MWMVLLVGCFIAVLGSGIVFVFESLVKLWVRWER